MNNFVKICEKYDGGCTETYLYLCVQDEKLVIKGSSFNYNARKENVLCEMPLPNTLTSVNDVLQFIMDNHDWYSWATITWDSLRTNNQLLAFIEEYL